MGKQGHPTVRLSHIGSEPVEDQEGVITGATYTFIIIPLKADLQHRDTEHHVDLERLADKVLRGDPRPPSGSKVFKDGNKLVIFVTAPTHGVPECRQAIRRALGELRYDSVLG